MVLSLKLFFVASVLALFSLTHAAVTTVPDIKSVIPNKSNVYLTPENLLKIRAIQQKVAAKGSCNPNICFALDGSGSISSADYRAQKDFVELVSAIISVDPNAAYAAVQYGLRNVAISDLTSDANAFLLDVDRSHLAGAPRTFIAAGLGFCISELRPRTEDANKIVLLGDGRSNFGGNPVPVARQFLPPRGTGSICAVGVGFQNTKVLQDIVGGDRNKVLPVDGYFELIDILDVLVSDICNIH